MASRGVTVAIIAIPNLLAARLSANETAAIATLRNITSAQAQFQQTAAADVDVDSVGEYGMIRELSGAADVRDAADGTYGGGGANTLMPALLPGSFREMKNAYEATKAGYHFRIFLVNGAGQAVSEDVPSAAFTIAAEHITKVKMARHTPRKT